MDTFNDFRLDGRFINVEISNKGAGRGRGGKREDEGRSKKKSQPNSRKQKTIEAFDKAFGGKKKKLQIKRWIYWIFLTWQKWLI